MTITLHLSSYLRTLQPTVLVKSAWRFCLQTHRIPMTLHASARRLTTWISRYSMFFDVSTTFRRPRRKIHVSTTFRRPRRKVHVSTTFRRPRRKVNVSTTFRRPRRKVDVSTTFRRPRRKVHVSTTFRRPRRKVHVSTNETSLSLPWLLIDFKIRMLSTHGNRRRVITRRREGRLVCENMWNGNVKICGKLLIFVIFDIGFEPKRI